MDTAGFEKMQADTLIKLADKAIETRGSIGALRWAGYVQVEEVKAFTKFVKDIQMTGGDTVKMTDEIIQAYNHMLYAAGLLTAIISQTQLSDVFQKTQERNPSQPLN